MPNAFLVPLRSFGLGQGRLRLAMLIEAKLRMHRLLHLLRHFMNREEGATHVTEAPALVQTLDRFPKKEGLHVSQSPCTNSHANLELVGNACL